MPDFAWFRVIYIVTISNCSNMAERVAVTELCRIKFIWPEWLFITDISRYVIRKWVRFYISLTVHPGIILVNNRLDSLISMYLFHSFTCFEQPNAHHQENQLYQYLIWYISLCVGDCLLCRSGVPSWPAYQAVTYTEWLYTRWCIDTIDSPDDEHRVARNM